MKGIPVVAKEDDVAHGHDTKHSDHSWVDHQLEDLLCSDIAAGCFQSFKNLNHLHFHWVKSLILGWFLLFLPKEAGNLPDQVERSAVACHLDFSLEDLRMRLIGVKPKIAINSWCHLPNSIPY